MMIASIRRFWHDRAGSMAPLGVVSMVVAVGMAAIAVDVGNFHLSRRSLQTTADLAAIAAAENIDHARAAAEATVVASGYPAEVLGAVDLGTYRADPATDPDQRFTISDATAKNAVRVRLKSDTAMVFGAVLRRLVATHEVDEPSAPAATTTTVATASDAVTIGVEAVAASSRFASLSVGSRLLQVQGGILNALLGGLLGANVSLTVLDYQALAKADVDLFAFARALATRVDLEAVSYDTLLGTRVAVGDVVGAIVEAARADPNANATALAALVKLAGATAGLGADIDLSRLLDLGPFGGTQVDGRPLIGARVDALGLVQAVAQLVDGDHYVAASVDAGLTGLATVSVRLAIGERPVGRPWFAVGLDSVSVHTSQVRLFLDVAVLGDSSLALVHLPVYAEIAAATATLSQVDCAAGSVRVAARPALLDVWIGDVDETAMTNMTIRPSPKPATLINLLLLKIQGRANVTIGNLSDAALTFTAADIAAGRPKTVSTKNLLGSLTTGLLDSLVLTIDNHSLLLVDTLTSLLSRILKGVTTPVDSLLSETLALLGVGIGQADVWVHGTRCDGAVLVN